MNREELKEKMCKISNSEFPLIDFFNDIGWLEGIKWFNTEKAYEDIEKIYNVFMFYINKCNKLEKENKELRKAVRTWNENGGKLLRENEKLKKALDILKEKGLIFTSGESGSEVCVCLCDYGYGVSLTKDEYELLKEVFESVGGDDE